MKTLLTIIAAASLVVGCGVFEEEQTTTDTGASNVSTTTTTTGDSGSTTTTTDSGGGGTTTPAPSAPSPAVANWSGTKQLGTSSNDQGYSITGDSSGNVYVTGYTSGGLDGNTSAGTTDLFVVKYDSGGNKQWTQQLGTSGYDFAHSISSDPSGNVYSTGYTHGDLDGNIHTGGLTLMTGDLFVVKYDTNGNKQ
jgi:hypothetical protein